MKDLCIFKDYRSKSSTKLPDYSKDIPTFQGFFFADNDNKQIEDDMYLICANNQKVLDVQKTDQLPLEDKLYLTQISDQKVIDIEKTKQSSSPRKRSQKFDNAETIPSISYIKGATKKTCTNHIIKLNVKAKKVRDSLSSS